MLDLLLLSTNFFDSGHFLIDIVFVPDADLLFLFLLSSSLGCSLRISLSLFLLFFLSPLENDIVVFSLQVLQFFRLLLRFSDFLHGTIFFVLEHTNAVAKQVNISLELKSDRASLVIG